MVSESHCVFCSLHHYTLHMYTVLYFVQSVYILCTLFIECDGIHPFFTARVLCNTLVLTDGQYGVDAESNALCNCPTHSVSFVLISQVSRADIRAPSVGYGHCKWRNPVVQAYGISGDKSLMLHGELHIQGPLTPIIIPTYNN